MNTVPKDFSFLLSHAATSLTWAPRVINRFALVDKYGRVNYKATAVLSEVFLRLSSLVAFHYWLLAH